eukprot:g1136.t1
MILPLLLILFLRFCNASQSRSDGKREVSDGSQSGSSSSQSGSSSTELKFKIGDRIRIKDSGMWFSATVAVLSDEHPTNPLILYEQGSDFFSGNLKDLDPKTQQTRTWLQIDRFDNSKLSDGQRVMVFWPHEKAWFKGTFVGKIDGGKLVEYDDGDKCTIDEHESNPEENMIVVPLYPHPSESTKAVGPAKTTKAAGPAKPTKAVGPAKPTKAVGPAKPTKVARPSTKPTKTAETSSKLTSTTVGQTTKSTTKRARCKKVTEGRNRFACDDPFTEAEDALLKKLVSRAGQGDLDSDFWDRMEERFPNHSRKRLQYRWRGIQDRKTKKGYNIWSTDEIVLLMILSEKAEYRRMKGDGSIILWYKICEDYPYFQERFATGKKKFETCKYKIGLKYKNVKEKGKPFLKEWKESNGASSNEIAEKIVMAKLGIVKNADASIINDPRSASSSDQQLSQRKRKRENEKRVEHDEEEDDDAETEEEDKTLLDNTSSNTEEDASFSSTAVVDVTDESTTKEKKRMKKRLRKEEKKRRKKERKKRRKERREKRKKHDEEKQDISEKQNSSQEKGGKEVQMQDDSKSSTGTVRDALMTQERKEQSPSILHKSKGPTTTPNMIWTHHDDEKLLRVVKESQKESQTRKTVDWKTIMPYFPKVKTDADFKYMCARWYRGLRQGEKKSLGGRNLDMNDEKIQLIYKLANDPKYRTATKFNKEARDWVAICNDHPELLVFAGNDDIESCAKILKSKFKSLQRKLRLQKDEKATSDVGSGGAAAHSHSKKKSKKKPKQSGPFSLLSSTNSEDDDTPLNQQHPQEQRLVRLSSRKSAQKARSAIAGSYADGEDDDFDSDDSSTKHPKKRKQYSHKSDDDESDDDNEKAEEETLESSQLQRGKDYFIYWPGEKQWFRGTFSYITEDGKKMFDYPDESQPVPLDENMKNPNDNMLIQPINSITIEEGKSDDNEGEKGDQQPREDELKVKKRRRIERSNQPEQIETESEFVGYASEDEDPFSGMPSTPIMTHFSPIHSPRSPSGDSPRSMSSSPSGDSPRSMSSSPSGDSPRFMPSTPSGDSPRSMPSTSRGEGIKTMIAEKLDIDENGAKSTEDTTVVEHPKTKVLHIGQRVNVYWPGEKKWFTGVYQGHNLVLYDADGETIQLDPDMKVECMEKDEDGAVTSSEPKQKSSKKGSKGKGKQKKKRKDENSNAKATKTKHSLRGRFQMDPLEGRKNQLLEVQFSNDGKWYSGVYVGNNE